MDMRALHNGSRRRRVSGLPCHKLKELRMRAGLSGPRVAQQLGYSYPSGYLKYEQERQWGDKLIPEPVIRKLIPLIVGAGNPPVTLDELVAIADRPVQETESAPTYEDRVDIPALVEDGHALLVVRYRVERGAYIRVGDARNLGASRIGPAHEYDVEDQWVAVLGHDTPALGPRGTQLHCISPDGWSPEALDGRRVLVGVHESGSLVEVRVAKVRHTKNSHLDFFTLGRNLPIEGTILGVIVGVYTRE